MDRNVAQLVIQAQSADKKEREAAESSLLQFSAQEPESMFLSLIDIACNSYPLTSRQFSLLFLRRLVTMYWSAGFESYVGPPGVGSRGKSIVRESLLRLSLDDSQDIKIKNSSSYCVVQISAVDFPDEWPDLLIRIYEAIVEHYSLNAMSLLTEIFDDVVSEEMFFQGGIGWQTIQIVSQVLTSSTSSVESKSAALDLYHACVLQLESPEATSTIERKHAIAEHIKQMLGLFIQLLQFYQSSQDEIQPTLLKLKASIYENLGLLKSNFSKQFFPEEEKNILKGLVLKDLHAISNIYYRSLNNTDDKDIDSLDECAIHIIVFLSSLHELVFSQTETPVLLDSLTKVCCLTDTQTSDWDSCFNIFVTKETGLAASYSARDESFQFFNNLTGTNYTNLLAFLTQNVHASGIDDWKYQESLIYLMEAAVNNDEEIANDFQPVLQTLDAFSELLASSETNEFVKVRVILILPKILEKFMDSLEDIKLLVKKFLFQTFTLVSVPTKDILKVASLISFTYYSSFAELDSVLGTETYQQLKEAVLKVINEIYEDAEDDTPALLLETLNQVIGSTSNSEVIASVRFDELQLILKISAKDPSNIQVVLEAQECLQNLLENVSLEVYLKYAEMAIPSFVDVLKSSNSSGFEYSPILSLSLELLTVFMKKKPINGTLPPRITDFVFQPLSETLVGSQDDEVLQLTTDIYSFLINNSENSQIAPHLNIILSVLEKLLSINTSDSAAMNVGSLIIAIFCKLSDQLQETIPTILEAAAKRLVQVHNIATAENLIFVFCYLTSTNPSQTVDFLSSLVLDSEGNSALKLILPKWLESFEIIRGEKRIKENILALSKLFFLNDERISSIIVNGDLIPYDGDLVITRSMSKRMPEKYTQISAYEKIVKLFVAELSFQGNQPGLEKYIPHDLKKYDDQAVNAANDGDDDDWEDVNDVLEYEKLQEYVDDESDLEDDEEGDVIGIQELHQSTRELLTQFFREAAAKNVSGFQEIYNHLNDDEKRVLTENLV